MFINNSFIIDNVTYFGHSRIWIEEINNAKGGVEKAGDGWVRSGMPLV